MPTSDSALFFSGSYDYNGRGIDDIEPSPDPNFSTPYYDSNDLREYRSSVRATGLVARSTTNCQIPRLACICTTSSPTLRTTAISGCTR